MPDTKRIYLGREDNGETLITGSKAILTKIKFKNTTAVEIVLFTPQGINPQGETDIAAGATETRSGFKLSSNKKATYEYSWDNKESPEAAPRTGTIRVTQKYQRIKKPGKNQDTHIF